MADRRVLLDTGPLVALLGASDGPRPMTEALAHRAERATLVLRRPP